MRITLRVILPGILAVLAVLSFTTNDAYCDPCLVVYSAERCTYHYESAEYYTVTAGHPLYDPLYDRGGEVLIEVNTNQIDLSVYQAPNLIGFVHDEENQGYFVVGTDFHLIVDGFHNEPTTFVNLLLLFDSFEPDWCTPAITIDGNPALFEPGLGWYYPIGDLVVSTPTSEGNNYSDTVAHSISWAGCSGLRSYAFSDENFNLQRDGGECRTAFSHDITLPVEEKTWGAVKTLYAD